MTGGSQEKIGRATRVQFDDNPEHIPRQTTFLSKHGLPRNVLKNTRAVDKCADWQFESNLSLSAWLKLLPYAVA